MRSNDLPIRRFARRVPGLLVLLLGGSTVLWIAGTLVQINRDFTRVEGFWRGGALHFSTLRGGVVITHLIGRSQEANVWAALPQPIFIPDSGGPIFTLDSLRRLSWKGEDGQPLPMPPVGSKIRALYYCTDYSEWRTAR